MIREDSDPNTAVTASASQTTPFTLSLADFEAVSDFAEVVIESSNPVLVHGPVADVTVNCLRVIEPLVAAGLSGSFECYDEADALILEKSFSSVGGDG